MPLLSTGGGEGAEGLAATSQDQEEQEEPTGRTARLAARAAAREVRSRKRKAADGGAAASTESGDPPQEAESGVGAGAEKLLTLSLKRPPFDVMVTGEKKMEFREKSSWMTGRLVDSKTGQDKFYDRVLFRNGYGESRPAFTVSYKGYKLETGGIDEEYSNGLRVHHEPGEEVYVIFLGDDVVVCK